MERTLEQLIDEAVALVKDLDEKAAPVEAKLAEIRATVERLGTQLRDLADSFGDEE